VAIRLRCSLPNTFSGQPEEPGERAVLQLEAVLPIWPCTERGLPLFTLTHHGAGFVSVALSLHYCTRDFPCVPPCGARTFLSILKTKRPPARPDPLITIKNCLQSKQQNCRKSGRKMFYRLLSLRHSEEEFWSDSFRMLLL